MCTKTYTQIIGFSRRSPTSTHRVGRAFTPTRKRMFQICPFDFTFRWCFLYAEHCIFLPHRNALNERHTHRSSFLESLSNSCISLLVVAILLHHHRCTDVLERPLYDVKINGFQRQCPATLASFSSLSPNNFWHLSSFLTFHCT